MSGDLETENVEEQSKAWKTMVDSVIDFISASKMFLQIINEKLEECIQPDRNQKVIEELHVNKSFNESTKSSVKCPSIYAHFKEKNTAASEFLDEQYNLMKQAIARRYQPQFRENIIPAKHNSNKDRVNKTFTEAMDRIYRVSSERKLQVSKTKKQCNGSLDKMVKEKPEATRNIPTYVLYEKEKYKKS